MNDKRKIKKISSLITSEFILEELKGIENLIIAFSMVITFYKI
jgi:hypothetical protein